MLLLLQKNFVLKGFRREMKMMAESTRKGKVVESSNPRNMMTVDLRCWIGARKGITCRHPFGLDCELEWRFQGPKHKLDNGVKVATYLKSSCNNGTSSKKVVWVNAVGLALTQFAFFSYDYSPTSIGPWAVSEIT